MTHPLPVAVRLFAAATLLGCRWLPNGFAPNEVDRLRLVLGCDLMNEADSQRIDRGYYEDLLDIGPDPGEIPPICRAVPELREVVLRPDLAIMRRGGATWSTNSLGMRDQPYTQIKPPGTFRIAMAGDSIGVGLGVDDGRGFEPTLERWLQERSRAGGGPPVELLNFAVPSRSPGQRWDQFTKAAWATAPDLVLFEGTLADVDWDARRLAQLLPRGIGWNSPLYGDVLERSGSRPGATSEHYEQALRPYRWDLVAQVYRAVAADCRSRSVPCIWVLIPRVGRVVDPAEHRRLLDLARAAGFTAIVDVSDAFDGLDPTELALRPSDFHPNAEGHAVVARRLLEALWRLPVLVPLRGIGSCGREPAGPGGGDRR